MIGRRIGRSNSNPTAAHAASQNPQGQHQHDRELSSYDKSFPQPPPRHSGPSDAPSAAAGLRRSQKSTVGLGRQMETAISMPLVWWFPVGTVYLRGLLGKSTTTSQKKSAQASGVKTTSNIDQPAVCLIREENKEGQQATAVSPTHACRSFLSDWCSFSSRLRKPGGQPRRLALPRLGQKIGRKFSLSIHDITSMCAVLSSGPAAIIPLS